jgi:hypothetical protein
MCALVVLDPFISGHQLVHAVHETGWERVWIRRVEPKHVELHQKEKRKYSADGRRVIFGHSLPFILVGSGKGGGAGAGGKCGKTTYLLARALVQGRTGSLGGAESSLRASLLKFTTGPIPERFFICLFGGPGDLGQTFELRRRRRTLSEADAFLS